MTFEVGKMDKQLEAVINELKEVRMTLPVAQYLPTDTVLDEYEKQIGFTFTQDYRDFLKTASDSICNGKAVLRITETRDHSRELALAIDDARYVGVPDDWLPFCEDNGDYFCFLSDGTIHFWTPDGTTNESWPDLATWIKDVWIEGN